MTDYPKALAAAREALTFFDSAPDGSFADQAAQLDCVGTLRDLLSALDAAQGEAVVEFMGRRRTPEKTSECWGVMLCDSMQDPPKGTKLYLAPQAPPAADYAGDAGPATDDDFVDLPAAVANVTPLRQHIADYKIHISDNQPDDGLETA